MSLDILYKNIVSWMTFQIYCWRKCLWAFFTMIWFLSWVSSLVLLQAAWSRKYCRTLFTRKWWFLRLQTSKNVFGHSLQEYGSSPEWILWWFHRLPAYENVLKHFLQWMNESSDVLLEKMSLGVLYKNMVSPWMCSLVYLQKTSWEYLLRFTMSLTIKVYCSTLEID